MFSDNNDYPLPLHRRALRSAMFRSGLTSRLGPIYWDVTDTASYIHTLHRRKVDMFRNIASDFADPLFGAMIGEDSARWSQFEEIVTAIDDCWVEPNRGQIIGPDGRLVRQSLTHRLVAMFPSAMGYARRGAGSVLSEAVVYDGFNSRNYFHHLTETLPCIELFLERSGLSADTPLVVNRWIFESRFFAYLYQRSSSFAGLNWRIQEPGEWLRVGRAYRLQAAPFVSSSLAKIRAMYGHIDGPKGRRLFLSRDSNLYGRGIENEAEVAAMLGRYGFETMYAEHLTLKEQQRSFEQATHVVALHGMGLVQQLFMTPATGHVIELMPGDRLHSVYYWQAWALRMGFYDVQAGTAMSGSGTYKVDVARLETGVRRMLDHPVGQRRYGETLIPEQDPAGSS